MFDWTLKKIEKLREEPEEQRRHVALVAAASITGVIFLGWAATLGSTFVAIEGGGGGIEEQTTEAASALSALSQNVTTEYQEVRGSVDEALQSIRSQSAAPASSAPTTTPTY